MTLQEKLAAVAALMDGLRWAKDRPGAPEHAWLAALKAVDADLRASLDGAPQAAEVAIGRVVESIRRHGSTPDRRDTLAREVVARWPAVKLALERFGAEKEVR